MRWKGLALIVAAVAFACGGSSTSSNNTSTATQLKALDHKVTVNFWHAMHSGTQNTAITKIAQDFNASQSFVTVNLIDQVDYGTLNNKTLAALAAGSPPDAAQCYENWAAKYKQSKALADLTPYINAADGINQTDLKDIYPIMVQDGKLNNTQYMFPMNKSDYLLFTNTDMLTAAGITTAPTSWDELKADAPKVTKSGATWAIDFPDTLGMENILESQVYAYGGTILDSKNQKAAFNQKAPDILQIWADLVKNGYAKRVGGASFPDQTDFGNGKTAFYVTTIASYPFVKSAVGSKFKFKTAAMPAGPKGSFTEMVGTNACVFTKAPADVQQGAFQFIKFFASKTETTYWSQTTGYIPLRQSAVAAMSDFYATNPDLKVAPDQLPHAIVAPALAIWNEAAGKIQQEMVNALDGRKSPKQAMDDAATQVNDLIATG